MCVGGVCGGREVCVGGGYYDLDTMSPEICKEDAMQIISYKNSTDLSRV